MGEPGGMSGTPHRQARLEEGFWMIFGTLFGHSGTPLEARGTAGIPKMARRWLCPRSVVAAAALPVFEAPQSGRLTRSKGTGAPIGIGLHGQE